MTSENPERVPRYNRRTLDADIERIQVGSDLGQMVRAIEATLSNWEYDNKPLDALVRKLRKVHESQERERLLRGP